MATPKIWWSVCLPAVIEKDNSKNKEEMFTDTCERLFEERVITWSHPDLINPRNQYATVAVVVVG